MPRTKFSEGERVLCFHGPLIYEAKCLKVSLSKDKMTPKYFIHYAGWNKNWDEWVPETRILKYNDANLSKQEEVKLAHNDQQKLLKKSRKSKTHSSNLSDSSSESGSSSGRKESKGAASVVATESLATAIATTATATATATSTTSTIATRLKRDSISRTSTPNSEITNDGERTSSSSSVMTPGTTASAAISKPTENGNGPSKRKRTKVAASTTTIETTANVSDVAEETDGQSEQSIGTVAATSPEGATQEEDENNSQIVPKESFLKQLEINFAIPKELNVILVDDWNFVLRERKLLTIPAKVSVVTVLKNFVEWQKDRAATSAAATSTSDSATSGSSPDERNLCIGAVEEFVEGIKDYFNVMLGSQLLYRFERIQFAEVLEKYPGKKMMEIYGSFHLLRMFVRLGATISHSLMDEKCIQLLQFHVKQLLTYLSKNNVFDFSEYYPASPEYIRKTL